MSDPRDGDGDADPESGGTPDGVAPDGVSGSDSDATGPDFGSSDWFYHQLSGGRRRARETEAAASAEGPGAQGTGAEGTGAEGSETGTTADEAASPVPGIPPTQAMPIVPPVPGIPPTRRCRSCRRGHRPSSHRPSSHRPSSRRSLSPPFRRSIRSSPTSRARSQRGNLRPPRLTSTAPWSILDVPVTSAEPPEPASQEPKPRTGPIFEPGAPFVWD